MNAEDKIMYGRPYGVGLMWRKAFDEKIHIITYDDPKKNGLEVDVCNDFKLLFVCVYLPYEKVEHNDDFM